MPRDNSEDIAIAKQKQPEGFFEHIGHAIRDEWNELSGHNDQIRMMKKEAAATENDKKYLPDVTIHGADDDSQYSGGDKAIVKQKIADADDDAVIAKKKDAAGDDDAVIAKKKDAAADDIVLQKKLSSDSGAEAYAD